MLNYIRPTCGWQLMRSVACVFMLSEAAACHAGPVAFRNFVNEADVSFVVMSVGSQRLDVGLQNAAPAQRFTPQLGGTLQSISTVLNREYHDPAPLIVEIRTSQNDEPGALLGSVSTPLASISATDDSLVTIDFSSTGVMLSSGEDYFTVFRTDYPTTGASDVYGHYQLRTMTANPLTYGRGPIHSQTGGSPPWIDYSLYYPQEIGLIVRVVPEPAGLLLALLGSALALFGAGAINSDSQVRWPFARGRLAAPSWVRVSHRERLMRYLVPRVLLCVILVSMGAFAKGATLVAASNRLPDPVGGTFAVPIDNPVGAGVPPVRIAQTFTAEISGRLLSASVTAASLDPDPSGLQLAVAALNNGQPGMILAIAPLQGLYVNGRFTDIRVLNAVADFDGSHVLLAAHQQYALLFVAQRHSSSFQVLGDQTAGTQRQYAGGELLRSTSGGPFMMLPGGDLVFQVTAETIPEPNAQTLLFAGVAAGRLIRGSEARRMTRRPKRAVEGK